MESTDNPTAIGWIFAYCIAHRNPCYVSYTMPEHAHMPHAGVSVELISLGVETSVIRYANGDDETVPTGTLSVRVSMGAQLV